MKIKRLFVITFATLFVTSALFLHSSRTISANNTATDNPNGGKHQQHAVTPQNTQENKEGNIGIQEINQKEEIENNVDIKIIDDTNNNDDNDNNNIENVIDNIHDIDVVEDINDDTKDQNVLETKIDENAKDNNAYNNVNNKNNDLQDDTANGIKNITSEVFNSGKILVSLIIPAYNIEDYIKRCLESLVNQTLKEIEIVIIDNSDNDKTFNVINEFIPTDPRITYVHNDYNIGPGPARNMGIELSHGEYVAFIDSDDYVSQNFCEELYKTATNTDGEPFDIVKAQYHVIENGNNINRPHANVIVRGKGKINGIFTCQHQAAIFKRKLLMDHPDARYCNSTQGEDLAFLNAVGYYAESMSFNTAAIYYYCIRRGSLYHGFVNPYIYIEEYKFSRCIIDFLVKVDAKDHLSRQAAKTRSFIDSVLMNNKQFENSSDPYLRERYEAVKEFRKELNEY